MLFPAGLDRQVGLSLLGFGVLAFVYYTFWILVLPFVGEKHLVRALFPENTVVLALGLPITVGFVFFTSVAMFAFIQMRKSKLKIT